MFENRMICLEDICLDIIVKEFERFNFAFSVSNNENLKRSFEFLQRKYSSDLLWELFEKEKLKDDYLRFLLNEHLEFLVEKWIYESSSYQCSKEYVFCRLPNLKAIHCHDTNDELFRNVAKFCPKIVEIVGETSSVTNQGVNYLCKKKNGCVPCPKLTKLFIKNSLITDKGVEKIIRNLKSLEELDHEAVPLALYSMHKKRLPKLEKVPSYNLVKLTLFDKCEESNLLPYYSDLLKICLTVCPKLISLDCTISDKEQLNFFNDTSLQHLSLTFTNPEIKIDNFLKKCGFKLIFFSVVNCIMSISKLSVSCPKLEYLIVDDVTFPDDHGDSKAVFHCLISFNFCQSENNKVSEKAISLILLSSPSLEEISFLSCDLSPNLKTYILKCCEKQLLKSISFMLCNNVEKDFVKDILLSCPSLETLDASDFPLTEQNELIQFAQTLPNKPCIDIF